jgi:hypothetical protein
MESNSWVVMGVALTVAVTETVWGAGPCIPAAQSRMVEAYALTSYDFGDWEEGYERHDAMAFEPFDAVARSITLGADSYAQQNSVVNDRGLQVYGAVEGFTSLGGGAYLEASGRSICEYTFDLPRPCAFVLKADLESYVNEFTWELAHSWVELRGEDGTVIAWCETNGDEGQQMNQVGLIGPGRFTISAGAETYNSYYGMAFFYGGATYDVTLRVIPRRAVNLAPDTKVGPFTIEPYLP